MLSAVRALHGLWPHARYAQHTEDQHQHPSESAQRHGEHMDSTTHTESIAGTLSACNQGFRKSQASPFAPRPATAGHSMSLAAFMQVRSNSFRSSTRCCSRQVRSTANALA